MDALQGVTVLDFTSHLAGPYCTKLLADLGARVIKVERPGGDPARNLPPFLGDQPGPDRSATFQYLNTNKESVILDLKQPASRDVVRALVGLADLVVTASPPRVEEALGIDYATLSSYKDLPVVAITNFGHDGPYRDYSLDDLVVYAMGAEMYSHGLASREPLKLGGTAATLQCGAMAAVAAMGALTAYEVHGVGQLVDVPCFTVQISNIDRRSSSILAYRFSGRVQDRPASHISGLAGGIYPVADGYVEIAALPGTYWRRFVEMIGDDTLKDPSRDSPSPPSSPAPAKPSTPSSSLDARTHPGRSLGSRPRAPRHVRPPLHRPRPLERRKLPRTRPLDHGPAPRPRRTADARPPLHLRKDPVAHPLRSPAPRRTHPRRPPGGRSRTRCHRIPRRRRSHRMSAPFRSRASASATSPPSGPGKPPPCTSPTSALSASKSKTPSSGTP
ncbi:CoA transferase [Tepidiforma flava]|uniref:CoA transferase n=1 Tax=Tepidiforma flava TaxID=3004094 RepID=A0ABY7M7E3_9CHLR|nr:CoA transferase [Tepidiforma flava]WBL36428.1 CoA transferase [Tepidiforma flava]